MLARFRKALAKESRPGQPVVVLADCQKDLLDYFGFSIVITFCFMNMQVTLLEFTHLSGLSPSEKFSAFATFPAPDF